MEVLYSKVHSGITAFIFGLSVYASLTFAGSEGHWAFKPVVRSEPPAVQGTDWVRNEIDQFVLARLEAESLAPSPDADPITLLRRLHLDLVGLPPTIAEIEAFTTDPSPYAYENAVNRLLASPHFGERWGRHWLDLSRYADSDGFEKDTVRPFAWRYRNWVIDALNRDVPYDQFTIEQLAGDLLPNADTDQRVATGFHRNTLTNKEGGVDQEQFRVEQVVDRTNTTASVFLGLTMACAQCHDHKYDPLSQKEYYGLYAFFNTAMEQDIPAVLPEEEDSYEAAAARHRAMQSELEKAVRDYRKVLESKLEEWEASMEPPSIQWTLIEPASMSSAGGATFTQLEDGSILVSGNSPEFDTYTLVTNTGIDNISGIRLEVLTDKSLPNTGPGRARHGNFILSEFSAAVAPPNNPNKKQNIEFESAWTDFWEKGWKAEAAIDGDPATGWSIDAWHGYNENRVAIFTTREGQPLESLSTLTLTMDFQYGSRHALGRFKIWVARGDREHLKLPVDLGPILNKKPEDRTDEEKAKLIDFMGQDDPEMSARLAALEAHKKAAPNPPNTKAQTLTANPEPPVTHVLARGDFLSPEDEVVTPHVPSVLPAIEPRGANPDRLDLARWIADPANPLTGRVAANRLWQYLFGQGLVVTTEDFGTRGQPPTHPELLDWLASEYVARGWSTKSMIRLIVTSSTYRQSSAMRAELLDRDPHNELLARQNRFRVEAEITRDIFLAAGGLLDPTVGGPSVRPPLPPGVAELGYANSVKWQESSGTDRYRRGLYILFQRTVPYPMLMTFDCPDSNTTCVRRARSNTPLQALTLMNDPVFVECAKGLGKETLASAPPEPRERLRHAFRTCLSREPAEDELESLMALFNDQLEAFKNAPEEAQQFIKAYESEGVDPQESAAYIAVARAIMNLDEFVTRE